MDVSIIIVSYNTKNLLADCIKSIKSTDNNLNVEIFVVDNNSSDATAEYIKKNFKQVNLIENKQNFGFSKANNQALKIAKGKYVLILNPDTKLFKDTLKSMYDFMEKNTNVGISTCRVELASGELDRDCRRRFPTPWRAFTHFSGLSKIFPNSKTFDSYYMGYISDAKQHEIDSAVGAFMFTRKSAIEKVGLFDEDFFFYGEDLDWCWRFKEAGYKIFYTPGTKIIHYKGASSGMKKTTKDLTSASKESKKRALYESVHSMEIFYRKHYTPQYPFFVNWAVLLSFKLLERFRISSV